MWYAALCCWQSWYVMCLFLLMAFNGSLMCRYCSLFFIVHNVWDGFLVFIWGLCLLDNASVNSIVWMRLGGHFRLLLTNLYFTLSRFFRFIFVSIENICLWQCVLASKVALFVFWLSKLYAPLVLFFFFRFFLFVSG